MGLGLQCSGDEFFNTAVHDFPYVQGSPGAAEFYNSSATESQKITVGMVVVEACGVSMKGVLHGDVLAKLGGMLKNVAARRVAGEEDAMMELVLGDLEVLLLAKKANEQRQARGRSRTKSGGSSAGGNRGRAGSGVAGGGTVRQTLERLFEKHDKSKLPNIDKLLETYKGRENQLIAAVRGKYEGKLSVKPNVALLKIPMPPHLRASFEGMGVKELRAQLEKHGVPKHLSDNCLERMELVSLLLSRPPLARSMRGVIQSRKRLLQFHKLLQSKGAHGILEFWLSVNSYHALVGQQSISKPQLALAARLLYNEFLNPSPPKANAGWLAWYDGMANGIEHKQPFMLPSSVQVKISFDLEEVEQGKLAAKARGTMFDVAQEHAYLAMERIWLPKFLQLVDGTTTMQALGPDTQFEPILIFSPEDLLKNRRYRSVMPGTAPLSAQPDDEVCTIS
jgi:hypothetical protein